jgi:hypothetical protein
MMTAQGPGLQNLISRRWLPIIPALVALAARVCAIGLGDLRPYADGLPAGGTRPAVCSFIGDDHTISLLDCLSPGTFTPVIGPNDPRMHVPLMPSAGAGFEVSLP